MAYTPTEWQSGDIVTSAKLNKIEQGIVDAGSSGLPDYSEANDGDVLTAKEGTEEVTVVPEQTVTIVDAYVPLANVDISRLSDGSEVTVIVNGNSYNSVITGVDPSSLALGWGIQAFVSFDLSYFIEDQAGSGTAYFSAYDGNVSIVPGEYTVSVVATVPTGDYAPEWTTPSLLVNVFSTGFAFTLDKTYAEIAPFGPNVWFKYDMIDTIAYGTLAAIGYDDGMYEVSVYMPTDSTPVRTFTASSEDGVLTTT